MKPNSRRYVNGGGFGIGGYDSAAEQAPFALTGAGLIFPQLNYRGFWAHTFTNAGAWNQDFAGTSPASDPARNYTFNFREYANRDLGVNDTRRWPRTSCCPAIFDGVVNHDPDFPYGSGVPFNAGFDYIAQPGATAIARVSLGFWTLRGKDVVITPQTPSVSRPNYYHDDLAFTADDKIMTLIATVYELAAYIGLGSSFNVISETRRNHVLGEYNICPSYFPAIFEDSFLNLDVYDFFDVGDVPQFTDVWDEWSDFNLDILHSVFYPTIGMYNCPDTDPVPPCDDTDRVFAGYLPETATNTFFSVTIDSVTATIETGVNWTITATVTNQNLSSQTLDEINFRALLLGQPVTLTPSGGSIVSSGLVAAWTNEVFTGGQSRTFTVEFENISTSCPGGGATFAEVNVIKSAALAQVQAQFDCRICP